MNYLLKEIAQQCSYSGGTSVFRARTFVGIFDELLAYDDELICMQGGYYRQGAINSQTAGSPEISVIPNPANDNICISLSYTTDGICEIRIINAFGAAVIKEEMNCQEKNPFMSTRFLAPGVYTVKVEFNNKLSKVIKLVIAR